MTDPRISQLEAENARLTAALEAIVFEARREEGRWVHLKTLILRRARAALNPQDSEATPNAR